MKTTEHFWSYLAQFFLEREMFKKNVVEEVQTHILCSLIVFWKSCRLWELGKYYRAEMPQMTIWRMHIARWMIKDTNTFSGYVIFIVFPLQQSLEENASKLRYTHIPVLFSDCP